MSILKDALNRIDLWLENNQEKLYAQRLKQSLLPGVSREEIDRAFHDIDSFYYLPEELYELYEWHDGSMNSVIPLSSAMDAF